jgi:ribosomal protein S18 acetylase RimI-like enzyme
VPRAFSGPRNDRLRFQPITDADAAFLRALYADVRAEEMAPVPWSEAQKLAFLAKQSDLQHRHYVANYPGADLLLIESDSIPIGRIYVYRSASEIRLMDIALVPDWRNRGIGSGLVSELMAEARASDSSITLHVEPANPAQRMYRRLGFTLIEQRGVYDFLGWNLADALAS